MIKRCILYSVFGCAGTPQNTFGSVCKGAGARYLQEAVASATCTRKYLPDSVDLILYAAGVDTRNVSIFDKIIKPNRVQKKRKRSYYKILSMLELAQSDYDQILFLDTDAYFKSKAALGVFDVLCNFDIAIAQSPVLHGFDERDVPHSFPEYNSGVIAFSVATCSQTKKILTLFQQWLSAYTDRNFKKLTDQGPLRRCLYNSSVRIATLPSVYNYRDGIESSAIFNKRFTTDKKWVLIEHPHDPARFNEK
jgi:hypothetical protein